MNCVSGVESCLLEDILAEIAVGVGGVRIERGCAVGGGSGVVCP